MKIRVDRQCLFQITFAKVYHFSSKRKFIWIKWYNIIKVHLQIYELWLYLGCKQSGVFGTECDIPCPASCKNSTCHILKGTCFDREHGVYGSYCNLLCPANCKENRCHKHNGTCFTCEPGFTGLFCTTSKIMYHIKIWITIRYPE